MTSCNGGVNEWDPFGPGKVDCEGEEGQEDEKAGGHDDVVNVCAGEDTVNIGWEWIAGGGPRWA